jgi:hypothetical protein
MAGLLNVFVDLGHQPLAVEQARERVAEGEMFQQRLMALAVGDVAASAPQADKFAVFDDAEQRQRQPVQIFTTHLQAQLALVQTIATVDPVAQRVPLNSSGMNSDKRRPMTSVSSR